MTIYRAARPAIKATVQSSLLWAGQMLDPWYEWYRRAFRDFWLVVQWANQVTNFKVYKSPCGRFICIGCHVKLNLELMEGTLLK